MRLVSFPRAVCTLASLTFACCGFSLQAADLSADLVAYWPLDNVVGDKTPDLVNAYDLSPYFGASHVLTNANAIVLVDGHKGKAMSFDNANQILLGYIAGAADQLPINKHPALTISFWVKGAPNQNDRRMFSEGNLGNNNPLFNIGSNTGGAMADLFFRQQPNAADLAAGYGDFGGGAHLLTVDTSKPLDNQWRHLMFVQQADGTRTIYLDGVADGLAIPVKPAGNWNVNATSIGGILRSTAGAWITAQIDEVALWKRALTQEEIDLVQTNGLTSVFPPLAEGLVSHWPLDEMVGDKSPDLVSGYDLSPYFGASHVLTNANAIVLVDGHKGKAVSFDNANQVLLGYIAGLNDNLPINKHEGLTISYWVKGAPNQNDRRMFSEGNLGNNNPLFNIGSNTGGGMVDFFFRQQPNAADLAAGYGDFGGGAHLLTLDTTKPFDNGWHLLTFVQETNGTRTVFIDGVADGLALPVKPAGKWNVNATSVGGILRSTAGAWITAQIDDVAVWKRSLTVDEIESVRTNGVPKTFTRKLPLQIRAFAADRPSVGAGDTVKLNWEASADANLSISPGIGDVTAQSAFGVGSSNVVVNTDTTYTFTATRGSESTNRTFTVRALAGVSAGWRLIDHFNFENLGHIGGQGNWQNNLTSVGGTLNPANVLQADQNRILGLSGQNILAGFAMNSMSVVEGKSNTLFFRFYIPASAEVADGNGLIPDIDILLGLTEKGLRDVPDFRGGGNGPSVRIIRQSAGAGGPIDLRAANGVNSAGGSYSWVGDAVNNPNGDGLQVGKVYNVWMDIANKPYDVVAGVQNGGDLYSVFVQKEGDAARTNLFANYVADRDAVNVDPVLGAAGPTLTHLYLVVNNQVTPQGTNTVRFDDFFLSADGFVSAQPRAAGSFAIDSDLLKISTFGLAAGAFTVTWNSLPGQTFTVHKRTSLSSGSWTQLVTGYPVGGAVDPTTTYSDNAATGPENYYQITSP